MKQPMPDLIDRLRDMGCDRSPFTPQHKDCICRLTNAAADEIEQLRHCILAALDNLHHDDPEGARAVLANKTA